MNKLTKVLVLLIVVGLLLPAVVVAQDEGTYIRYPITSEPEHMNPFTQTTISVGLVLANIHEGLVSYDTVTGDYNPALAESWEITENDDGQQVFTFNLRQGVLFHDIEGVEYGEGEREVTADDILWNYMTALSGDEDVSTKAATLSAIEGAAAYTAGEAEDVPGLEVVDDYTFRITLESPDRLFLVNGMIRITSPAAYEQLGDAFTNTPVGTGPFQFVEWLREDRLVLEAYDEYWNPELPKVDGIRFISYGDANTALLDYREDNLDFLFAFPSGQRGAIIEEFPDEFNEKPGLHIRYWGFNMKNGFFFENPLVRKALSHALDRETAWDILEEGARFPANLGMLPPSMPASTPATVYDYNLETAAALLEEAGFPGGEGMPVVKIHLFEPIAEEAQVVLWQEDLESLGIEVEFIVEGGSTYWDSISGEDAMVYQTGWAAGLIDPSDVFDYLVLDGADNGGYNNEDVNVLLRAARVELDAAVRNDLYQQAHDIIMEDAAFIPSAYSKVTWLQKPWVSGFEPGGGGTYTADLEYVEINR